MQKFALKNFFKERNLCALLKQSIRSCTALCSIFGCGIYVCALKRLELSLRNLQLRFKLLRFWLRNSHLRFKLKNFGCGICACALSKKNFGCGVCACALTLKSVGCGICACASSLKTLDCRILVAEFALALYDVFFKRPALVFNCYNINCSELWAAATTITGFLILWFG